MIEIILAFTSHFLPGDWNEVHPGIRWTDPPYMAAAYYNSEGGLSVALGFSWNVELSENTSIFADLAGVTGYEAMTIAPMVRAGVEFNDSLRLFAAPAMTADGDFGAVVGIEIIAVRF